MSASEGYPAGGAVSNRPSTSTIVRLYVDDCLSPYAIAKQFGCAHTTVRKRLKQAGCALRSASEAISLANVGRPKYAHKSLAHPGEPPADKWEIVRLKVAGKSNLEIAKLFNRSVESIYVALRGVDFPVGRWSSICHSFGEPFDRNALRTLYLASGLNLREMADQLGVPYNTLSRHTRGKICARGVRESATQLDLRTARKGKEWMKGLLVRLMATASKNPGVRLGIHSQSRVLMTLFPNLRERYRLLIEALAGLQKRLRANPAWSVADLQRDLCEQARLEKAGRIRGDLFRRFLPWAPELMQLLGRRLPYLRGERCQRLAWALLADSLGTTQSIISEVLNPSQAAKIRPIPPEHMRWLILSGTGQMPGTAIGAAEHREKEKPARGRRATNTKLYVDADALSVQGRQWPQIAEILIPEDCRVNRHAAAEKLRQGVIRLRRKRRLQQRQSAPTK